MAKNCDICGKKISFVSGVKVKNGNICDTCGEKIGLNSSMASLAVAELLDIDDIKQAQLNNIEIDPKKVLATYKQNTKNGLKEPIYSIISNSQNQVIHSVAKHPCPICGNEIKHFENFRLKDGKICNDCGTKIGLGDDLKSMSVARELIINDVKKYQDTHTKIDPDQYLADLKLKEKISATVTTKVNKPKKDIKHPCPICGNEIKLFENFRLKDGKICDDCGTKIGLKNDFKSVSVADNLTIEDVKEFQDAHTKIDVKQYLADLKTKEKEAVAKEKQAAFDKKTEYEKLLITFKKEGNGHVGKVYMDNKRQQFLIKQTFTEHLVDTPPTLYNYSDLESYDPIENGTTIEKKHGLSRAIAGGLIAGPTGAAIGAFSGNKAYAAVSKVSVVLYFSGNHRVEAVLLNTDTKTDSGEYHAVKQLLLRFCHELDNIIAENSNATNTTTSAPTISTDTDQLRDLKGLLDDGVITQADFDAKKKQILGL